MQKCEKPVIDDPFNESVDETCKMSFDESVFYQGVL